MTKEEAAARVRGAMGSRDYESEIHENNVGPLVVVRRQGRAFSVNFPHEGSEELFAELTDDLVMHYDRQDWSVTL